MIMIIAYFVAFLVSYVVVRWFVDEVIEHFRYKREAELWRNRLEDFQDRDRGDRL